MAAFDFIDSDQLRACLERDAEELLACMRAGAWKAAHVIAGSLVQATLVDYLVGSGKIGEDEALRFSLPELLEICGKQQVLSTRTVDLAGFLRPYGDYLSPTARVRLRAEADETSARIAQALLELVINEVSSHKREHYRFTAEQVVAKVRSDRSSSPILAHLVGKVSRAGMERLLLELLPHAYLETARLDEPSAAETLQRLEQCYRVAFEAAPAELKAGATRRFVEVLENESEYVVRCYQTHFFRGSDLAFLDTEGRSIVQAHFFATLEKTITLPIVNVAAGFGAFLQTEEHVRAFFVPLVLSLLTPGDEALSAGAARRVVEEARLLSDEHRRSVESWVGRLRWSLQREDRTADVGAIARLEAALAAPSAAV